MLENIYREAENKAGVKLGKFDRRREPILYGDVPTFMELPIAENKDDIKGADIAVIGIPYEGLKIANPFTSLPFEAANPDEKEKQIFARTGTFMCPDEVRKASVHYNMAQGNGYFPEGGNDFYIMDKLKAVDYGNVAISKELSVEENIANARNRVKDIYNAGAIPIVLGGDHTIPAPVFEALAETTDGNFGIIDFDSHFDMSYTPKYWAGSQWASCFETGKVKPENFVQIGIRGIRQSFFWQYVQQELGYKYFTIRDIEDMGMESVISQAIAIASKGTKGIYVSLDYDCLDAALAPGQRYPDVAGITTRELSTALRMISQSNKIYGYDICCMTPRYDVQHIGCQFVARSILEVMSGIAKYKSKI